MDLCVQGRPGPPDQVVIPVRRAGQEEQARYAEAAAANPVDPVDLWGRFDPPPLPRGLLP